MRKKQPSENVFCQEIVRYRIIKNEIVKGRSVARCYNYQICKTPVISFAEDVSRCAIYYLFYYITKQK